MATNQYFNFYTNTEEQSLTNDLIVESLQIYGHDVRYLPREYTHVDDIFNEVRNSSFTNEFTIEMYIQGVDGFGGDGDLLSKFGVEIRDTQTFVVANTRFEEEATTASIGFTKPREGDLIYMPLTDQLMEIKHVEDEEVYYQLGKTYVYRLSTEFFEYSEEEFDTGVADIDDIQTDNEYTIQLTMGTGTGTFQVDEHVYQGADLANSIAKAEVVELADSGYTMQLTVDAGGVGIFEVDEHVYQGADLATSTAKAEVVEWDDVNLILTVRNVVGDFEIGSDIIGDTSVATHSLTAEEITYTDLVVTIRNIVGNFGAGSNVIGDTSGATYNLGVKETMVFPETTEADNKVYETNPDSVIDFSEDNPFSEDF